MGTPLFSFLAEVGLAVSLSSHPSNGFELTRTRA